MSAQDESRLTKRITDALNALPQTVAVKIVGDNRSRRGVADVLVCSHGYYIALEVKMPGRQANVSEAQRMFLDSIIHAGGNAEVVVSPAEAVAIVEAFVASRQG